MVSYCNAYHRTEDLRDATPGQAADSLANAGDPRKTQNANPRIDAGYCAAYLSLQVLPEDHPTSIGEQDVSREEERILPWSA